MNCYETAPEFIDEDNRRFRARNPISMQQMHNKHEALLPEEVVHGKSILDLGCCLGATGHWCLSHGATRETGIELQSEYAQIAEKLLNKYHSGKFAIKQMAIEEWLKQPDKPSFDVVCLLGVMYAFVDYYSILKLVASLTGSTLVIESSYFDALKKRPTFCGVAFMDDQPINLASETSSLVGRGTRVSPKGFEWLMKAFGFVSNEGIILPEPIAGTPDIYNRPLELLGETYPIRFLMRFIKTDASVHSLSEDLQRGEGIKTPWVP